MKKVFSILFAGLLLLSMCACGNGEKSKNDHSDASVSTTGAAQTEKEEITNTEAASTEEYGKFQLPRMELYCNVPMESGSSTNKRVGVVTGYDAYIGTVFCGGAGEYTGDLEGILAYVAEDYVNDTASFLMADLDPAELKAENTQKVTVSGYDAVKFSSSVLNKSGNEYGIYGYAMIIEDRPVMFVGVLRSEDQAAADLAEMKDLIDLMAGSIYK